MSDLDIFNVGDDVEVQEEQDTVGGYRVRESDLYAGVIKMAFLDAYDSGSKFINLEVELTDEDGNKFTQTEREVVWSANTKGPFYLDKKTGKKKQLIGLSKMNSLGELLCEAVLSKSNFEEKVVEVYSKDQGGKVKEPRQVLVDWLNKPVHVGLIKLLSNKQVKSGKTYVDTAEVRESNEIDKFFDEDKKTLLEVQKGKDAKFSQDWLDANKGKDRNKVKPVKGNPQAASGVPTATAEPLEFED